MMQNSTISLSIRHLSSQLRESASIHDIFRLLQDYTASSSPISEAEYDIISSLIFQGLRGGWTSLARDEDLLSKPDRQPQELEIPSSSRLLAKLTQQALLCKIPRFSPDVVILTLLSNLTQECSALYSKRMHAYSNDDNDDNDEEAIEDEDLPPVSSDRPGPSSSSTLLIRFILNTLQLFIKHANHSSIVQYLCSLSASDTSSIERTLQLLTSLPDRITNALHSGSSSASFLNPKPIKFPSKVLTAVKFFETQNFFFYLSQQSFALLSSNRNVSSSLIQLLTKRGASSICASSLLNCSSSASECLSLLRLVPSPSPASSIDSQSSATILWALLHHMTTSPHKDRVQSLQKEFSKLLAIPPSSSSFSSASAVPLIWQSICYDFILVKVTSIPVLKTITDIIRSAGSEPQYAALLQLSKSWKESSFLQHTTLQQHFYVTTAIVNLLEGVSKDSLIIGQPNNKFYSYLSSGGGAALSTLAQGVQVRLSSPLPHMQKLAALVANTFARIIDPSNPVKLFDDDWLAKEGPDSFTNIQPDVSVASSSSSGGNAAAASSSSPYPGSATPSSLSLAGDYNDHDHDFTPADLSSIQHQQDGEEEDNDDDDLKPFDLNDDEADLVAAPAPIYISDCIKGLRATKEIDAAEACLAAAEELVRSKPDDLDFHSHSLASTLLHCGEMLLSNSEHIQQRYRALVALCTCPSSDAAITKIVVYLCNSLYSDSLTIAQRLDIVHILADAALELSGRRPIPSSASSKLPSSQSPALSRSSSSQSLSSIQTPAEIFEKSQQQNKPVVEQGMSGMSAVKTRRFHSARPAKPETQVNRFAPLAATFTNSILSRVGKNAMSASGGDGKREILFPSSISVAQPSPAVSLDDDEGLMLASVVSVLGTFMECCGGDLRVQPVIRSFLELAWTVRNHADAAVRRAINTSLIKLFTFVPTTLAILECDPYMERLIPWLAHVMNEDADMDARVSASAALACIQRVLQEMAPKLSSME